MGWGLGSGEKEQDSLELEKLGSLRGCFQAPLTLILTGSDRFLKLL